MAFDYELFEAETKKAFGKEAITTVEESDNLWPAGSYIPSSSESLNSALGVGGLPKGRIVEIYGPEASGKTTLALDFVANLQRQDPNAVIFYQDNENALNPIYARAMGIDTSKQKFILSQTGEAEEALDLTYKAVKAGVSIAIVDSVAGLSLKSDMEDDETTTERVGGISKAFRAHLRKMKNLCAETGAVVIYLNHITYKIGVMFGNPETTPGGRGLPFFASVRLDVRAKEHLIDKKTMEPYGVKCAVKCVKNKVAPPFRKAEYEIIFGEGINKAGNLIDEAMKAEVITQSGPWLYFGEQKFKGRAKLDAAMTEMPLLEQAIKTAIERKR